ncbi:hypothetical protein FHW02_004055 [Ochrobactrum sp. RH1CCR137]|nr:hypothetical protein [Ochrobactrum sp. RH1CCR137]MBA8857690.1 hypothetical protein [Ochrobactrum sp. RH1CCR134]
MDVPISAKAMCSLQQNERSAPTGRTTLSSSKISGHYIGIVFSIEQRDKVREMIPAQFNCFSFSQSDATAS